MSGCGACTCGAAAARFITSSLASAQRGNEVVPHLSQWPGSVPPAVGIPGRARGLPHPEGVRGRAAFRLAPPPFPRGMGLCQPLGQLALKFEVNPLCSPARANSGLLTLGPECGHLAESLKETQNAPFVKKCAHTLLGGPQGTATRPGGGFSSGGRPGSLRACRGLREGLG